MSTLIVRYSGRKWTAFTGPFSSGQAGWRGGRKNISKVRTTQCTCKIRPLDGLLFACFRQIKSLEWSDDESIVFWRSSNCVSMHCLFLFQFFNGALARPVYTAASMESYPTGNLKRRKSQYWVKFQVALLNVSTYSIFDSPTQTRHLLHANPDKHTEHCPLM